MNRNKSATQSLLDLIPEGTEKGNELRKMLTDIDKSNECYGARKRHEEYMIQLSQTLPTKALQLLMKLQMALDELESDMGIHSYGLEPVKNIIFDVDEEDNLMNVITGLIGIVNQSKVEPAKKSYSTRNRLSRAETLARAQDPENPWYGFCTKCSRPMLVSHINNHQKNTNICVEIKAGRKATLEHQDARDERIGDYVADQVFHDDSEDE